MLRSQCLEAEARTDSGPKLPQEVPLSATDWCDDADVWGEEAEGFGAGVEEEEGRLVPEEAAGGGGGFVQDQHNYHSSEFGLT